MVTVTRRFTFSAGHRLAFHKGWCSNLHGHNYVVEITIARQDGGLDDCKMVVDFGVLKRTIGDWLHANWDHAAIIDSDDIQPSEWFRGMDYKVYSILGPPTAENMAVHLLQDVVPLLLGETDVEVTKVVIWENENSKATAEP